MEFYIKNKQVNLTETFSTNHMRVAGSALRQFRAKRGEKVSRCTVKVIVRKSTLIVDAPVIKIRGVVSRLHRGSYYIDADLPFSIDLPDEPYDWKLEANFLEHTYTLSYLGSTLTISERTEDELDEEETPGFFFDFAGHKGSSPFLPLAEIFPRARVFALLVAKELQKALQLELERLQAEEMGPDVPTRFSRVD